MKSTIFIHKNSGSKYRLLHIANQAAEADRKDMYPDTVVYERLSDGTIWTRSLSRWEEDFRPARTYEQLDYTCRTGV